MQTTHSNSLQQLEDWLAILLNTYNTNPSIGLAKVITYYIERLLHHTDICTDREKHCHYYSMNKFWQWQCQQF